jgi:hypothetical protein
MTSARARRVAAAAVLGTGLAASLVWAPPAVAEPLGPGWEGSFVAPFGDGFVATGEQLEVPVVFEYTGPPGSTVTDLTLQLLPRGGPCPMRTYTTPLDDPNDGAPPTTAPEGAVTVSWTFRVDPVCNAVYDVRVTATANVSSVVDPARRGTTSGALVAEAVDVSLAPPSPRASPPRPLPTAPSPSAGSRRTRGPPIPARRRTPSATGSTASATTGRR